MLLFFMDVFNTVQAWLPGVNVPIPYLGIPWEM